MSPATRSTIRNRQRGFTLLEMVAAMVLMTILFAALTSLLRSFADQRKSLDRLAAKNPSSQQLADLLRRDVTNARYIRSDSRNLSLFGNLSQDRRTGLLTGQRAEITYRIDSIAGEAWLVRREVQFDNASTQRTQQEPIWRGVSSIEVLAASELEPENDEPPIPGMTPMPSRLTVVLRTSDGAELLELNIVHHWEDS